LHDCSLDPDLHVDLFEYGNPFHNDNGEKDKTFINENNYYYERNENGISPSVIWKKEDNGYDNNDNDDHYLNDKNCGNIKNLKNEVARFGFIHIIIYIVGLFQIFISINNNNSTDNYNIRLNAMSIYIL